jgi:hypothetical protein
MTLWTMTTEWANIWQTLLSNGFTNMFPWQRLNYNSEELCFLHSLYQGVISGTSLEFSQLSRVEAGSDISTVALWVIGGNKKGGLESETVKYGRKSHGTQTQEWLHWQGPAAIVNDRLVFSSERAPTLTNLQLSDSNKYLVISSRWMLYFKTDWPTDRRSYYKTRIQFSQLWDICQPVRAYAEDIVRMCN